jgi:hypothetical protein
MLILYLNKIILSVKIWALTAGNKVFAKNIMCSTNNDYMYT